MKKYLFSQLIIFICVCCSSIVHAQHFNLLNINKEKDASPDNNNPYFNAVSNWDDDAAKYSFAVLKGASYFYAEDGIHGVELWRSDGTKNGTWMVKDINPGIASSNVHDLVVSGNKVYFAADDGINGREIWVTDGTNSGTRMLKDIVPYPNSGSDPTYLTDVNGTLYFFAKVVSANADELWKTDGTPEGTTMVADLYTPALNYSLQAKEIVNANGHLFFFAQSQTLGINELFSSDGTTAGTSVVAGIGYYYNSSPAYLTALNGSVYFEGDNGTGTQLWVSDGTAPGTHLVNNANGFYIYYRDIPLTVKDKVLYFEGGSDAIGYWEFCKYDPSNSTNNIELVKDINPGTGASDINNITNVNGTLFFNAYDGTDMGLWKSDGTTAGTQLVKVVNPGGRNDYPDRQFTSIKDELFFVVLEDIHGSELWKSNGTSAGTGIVKDIFPGIYSSYPVCLTPLNKNTILFQANDGVSGYELWKTNGFEEGTSLVKDINYTSSNGSDPLWLRQGPNDKLIFDAYTAKYGYEEVFISDGTEPGTKLLKDVFPGGDGSNSYLFTKVGNTTYFIATTNKIDGQLWKTDATTGGTAPFPIPGIDNENGYITGLMATDKLLYITTFNFDTFFYELWRTDGSPGGTYPLITTIDGGYSLNMGVAGNKLFFTNRGFDANGNYVGDELFVSNGSVGSTRLVKDIFPGPDNSYPQNLTAYKGRLYFTAIADNTFGAYLFSSDGTTKGTNMIAQVSDCFYCTYGISTLFSEANGKLFFDAYNTENGFELWVTDGSIKGTRLLKDINPASNSSIDPYNFQFAGTGSLFYFTADDGVHGSELWKSDGTEGGTKLVQDITPGDPGSNIYDFTNVADHFYFVKDGSLWSSGGNDATTGAVTSDNIPNVTGVYNLTAVRNKLYFTGYNYSVGNELYVGEVDEHNCEDRISSDAITYSKDLYENKSSFINLIYPNPTRDLLNVKINTQKAGKINLVLTDASGRTVMSQSLQTGQGELMIQLKVANLPAGTYFIKLTSDNFQNDVKKFNKE